MHQGDRWDRLPLIRVDEPLLRLTLKLPGNVRTISPYDLSQAKVELPDTHEQRPFVNWAEQLLQSDPGDRTTYEKQALELAQRYWAYQRHRMGDRLLVLPAAGDSHERWMPISELAHASFNDQSDPTGQLHALQEQFHAVRLAYKQSSEAFDQASADFLQTLAALQSQRNVATLPSQSILHWEVWYNHAQPFRCTAACMLLAGVCMVYHRIAGGRYVLWSGWGLYAIGLLALCLGFAMRMAVAGRWPVADLYESVVCAGLCVALLGIVWEMHAVAASCSASHPSWLRCSWWRPKDFL